MNLPHRHSKKIVAASSSSEFEPLPPSPGGKLFLGLAVKVESGCGRFHGPKMRRLKLCFSWSRSSALPRFGNAIEEAFAAQVKFTVHQRRRGAEGVFQWVDRERGIFTIVAQDDGHAVA